MKITDELLEQLIMEELGRLDEFKVTVKPFPTIDKLATDLSTTKSNLRKIPKDIGYPNNQTNSSSKKDKIVKRNAQALAKRGPGSKTDIDDGDFASAKALSTTSKGRKFADKVQQQSSDSDIKADWAGTGTTPVGSYGTFADISTFAKSKDLYAATKAAAKAIVADNTDANAKFALGEYLKVLSGNIKGGTLKQQAYIGKSGTTANIRAAASATNSTSWKDIVTVLVGGTSTAAATIAKAVLKDLATSLKAYEPQDITRPEMASVGADAGKQDQALISSFDLLFTGANTIEKRAKVLNDVSEAMIEGNTNTIDAYFGKGTESAKRKLLNAVVCMDYIAKFAKEVDDRAGAYYFESFCALIGGSAMNGGSNGSGDFKIAATGGDLSGSSKFLSGTNSKQAVGGFDPGVPVMYFFAKKVGGAKPEKTALQVWVFEIEFSKVDVLDHAKNQAKVTGDGKFVKFIPKGGGSNVNIEFAIVGAPTFTLQLSKASNKSFKQSLQDEVNKADTGSQAAFNKMKEYYSETRSADNGIKEYLASGDVSDGTAALSAVTNADKYMVELLELIRGAGKVTGTGAGRTLTENQKLSEKLLDKLIKEVIFK